MHRPYRLRSMRFLAVSAVHTACTFAAPSFALAGGCPTAGLVLDEQKISQTQGGFGDSIVDNGRFGWALADIGDLDGDGVNDLAVGAPEEDDGGPSRGAIWILFLNSNGTVKAEQKISNTQGGFTGVLDDNDFFGYSVASLGDLDGDGITDLAVGAPQDDDGGLDRGAVWILGLNSDGTVLGHTKISDTSGGFGGTLLDADVFGVSLVTLGDLDGDGVVDLAVGAPYTDDGAMSAGAVWILALAPNGTVMGEQKISSTVGGFGGTLDEADSFGFTLAFLGDLNGDATRELAVGAPQDGDGGLARGAVWVLSLASNGICVDEQKISDTQGGFTGVLDDTDAFGFGVSSLGDLDNDGVNDLLVGAPLDDDGGIGAFDRGAVWILFLNPDSTVRSHRKISDTAGGFNGTLTNGAAFGKTSFALGDLDQGNDGTLDVAIAAPLEDDGGPDHGAIWILTLDGCIQSCPADLVNGDNVINLFDLLELLANWGTNGVGADLAAPANVVNVFDLLELLSAWGPC